MEDKGPDIGAPGECVTHLTTYYSELRSSSSTSVLYVNP